ncbi:MAG: hypothetical protein VB084_04000 [Syntrophomonadaceae bacterium]|nr:hypothetical protein [Syntrophomonadaceae bacterium]
MKPPIDGFRRRICIFIIIAYAICLVLTAAAARSSAELERLRGKMTVTRMENVIFIPSFFPQDIFTEGTAGFDHEYVIIDEDNDRE